MRIWQNPDAVFWAIHFPQQNDKQSLRRCYISGFFKLDPTKNPDKKEREGEKIR